MSCSVLQERPPPHVHTYDMTSWGNDDDNHWRKATCEHTEEVKDKAAHTWDEGKVTTAAGYGTAGERTYTCTVCEKTKTEPIAALEAKDCSVAFAEDYSPNSSYNGKPIAIDKSKVVRIANGETTAIDDPSSISFMFKTSGADDSTYSEEAPSNSGSYIVKITVAGSAEWKECSQTFDFTISPAKLSLKAGKDLVFEFDNKSTNFTVNAANVFDGLAEGEEKINLVVEFNGKDAGSTHKAHHLEIGSSHANASNYVLAEAVETGLNGATIAPKKLVLSGTYYTFALGSTAVGYFILPSGTSENILLKAKLGRNIDWEANHEYDLTSPGYSIQLAEENGNYTVDFADSGVKVIVRPAPPESSKIKANEEIELKSDGDGYVSCYFIGLTPNKTYRIAVSKEGNPVSDIPMSLTSAWTLAISPVSVSYEYIAGDGKFVFTGGSERRATLYVKADPNTTYKIRLNSVE